MKDKNNLTQTITVTSIKSMKKNNKNKIEKSANNLIIYNNNDNEIEKDDYNDLPYNRALKLDNRNIFSIFISIFKKKIDIISIIFYPEEFSHYSLTLANFSFEFLFNYFMNALLYSDDVVSQKYHNNGQLEFITH